MPKYRNRESNQQKRDRRVFKREKTDEERKAYEEMQSYMDRVNWNIVKGYVSPGQTSEFRRLWSEYKQSRSDESLKALEQWIESVNQKSR